MQFWTTAGLSPEQVMPKETYVFIHRRISKALAPELSEAEAAEAAEEDWVEDAMGASEIGLEQCAHLPRNDCEARARRARCRRPLSRHALRLTPRQVRHRLVRRR